MSSISRSGLGGISRDRVRYGFDLMALPPPSYSDRQLPLLYFGHACLIGFGVKDPSVDLQGYVSTIHTFDRNLMSHKDEILGECERPSTQLAFFPIC